MKKSLKRAILAIAMVLLLVMPRLEAQAMGTFVIFEVFTAGGDGVSGVVFTLSEGGGVVYTTAPTDGSGRTTAWFIDGPVETWELAYFPAGYTPDISSGTLSTGDNWIDIVLTPIDTPPPPDNGNGNGDGPPPPTTFGFRFGAHIIRSNIGEYGEYEIFIPTDWNWPWSAPVLVIYRNGVEIGRSEGIALIPAAVDGINYGAWLYAEIGNLPQSPSEMGTFTWRIVSPAGPNFVWSSTSGEFDFEGRYPQEGLDGLYFLTYGLVFVAEIEDTNGNGENGNGENGNGENGNGENGNGNNGGGGAGERPAPQTGSAENSFILSGIFITLSMIFGVIAFKKKQSA